MSYMNEPMFDEIQTVKLDNNVFSLKTKDGKQITIPRYVFDHFARIAQGKETFGIGFKTKGSQSGEPGCKDCGPTEWKPIKSNEVSDQQTSKE